MNLDWRAFFRAVRRLALAAVAFPVIAAGTVSGVDDGLLCTAWVLAILLACLNLWEWLVLTWRVWEAGCDPGGSL